VVAEETVELMCDLIRLKYSLQEINFCDIQTMKMYCDNEVVVHIASNPVFHKRTKHIKVDCHFVREKLLTKETWTEFVGSNDQLTNVLTKCLKGSQIEFICSKLGTYNLYALGGVLE